MFYRQGFTIEAYDAAERDAAEVNAPRLPTNIWDLRPETVMLKNGARSMIDELEKVGDVTLCRLMTGGAILNMNPDYAQEVSQKYLESLTGGRR